MTKTAKDLSRLGVLLLVLAGVIYREYSGSEVVAPAPDPAAKAPQPSKSTVRPVTGKGAAALDESLMDVKLDLLAGEEKGSYGAATRDPFRFKPKPAPVVKAPPPVVALPPPPPPPVVVQRPQTDGPDRLIRYSGYIVNASGKAAALLSYGPSPATAIQLMGTEGEIIEGRYRLLRVEPNAIEVTELGGEGRRARIARQP